MKIVVTGALGHIGSRVIREFAKTYPDSEIVLIDNLLTQRYSSLFDLPSTAKYRFVEGDVLELDLVTCIKSATVVLHLAAITDATSSFGNREQVEYVNYNATVKVADACLGAGTPLIHLSSTSVYGPQNEVVDEKIDKNNNIIYYKLKAYIHPEPFKKALKKEVSRQSSFAQPSAITEGKYLTIISISEKRVLRSE